MFLHVSQINGFAQESLGLLISDVLRKYCSSVISPGRSELHQWVSKNHTCNYFNECRTNWVALPYDAMTTLLFLPDDRPRCSRRVSATSMILSINIQRMLPIAHPLISIHFDLCTCGARKWFADTTGLVILKFSKRRDAFIDTNWDIIDEELIVNVINSDVESADTFEMSFSLLQFEIDFE